MASAEEQREWLDELDQGWRRELAAGRRGIEEIWNTPLAERIREGHALGPLEVVRVCQDRVVLRPVHEDESGECRLREGDFVGLSSDTPWAPEGKFIHLGEDDDGIHLHRWRGSLPPPGSRDRVMDRDHVDLTERYAAAMEGLAGTALGRERILPLLMGDEQGEIDGETFAAVADELDDEVNDPLWHDSQKEAIEACVATRNAWLVQGPPGTGKTHVLAEVVRRLVERGERVLVTGPTHRAIGHALESCRRALPAAVRVAKIGPVLRGPESVESFESYAESGLLESAEPHVIGATPFALGSPGTGLCEARFDTVVVDEASQVTPMVAVMAMLHGERWLFFGDDHQLPPVLLVDDGRPARERSVFGLLRNRDFDSMLEETWRLNAELAEWPSVTFYRGRLSCRHDRRLTLAPPSDHPALATPAAVALVVRDDEEVKGSSVMSAGEAQETADLVRALVGGGLAPEEVGIITPFRAQAARIRQLLRIPYDGTTTAGRVTVDTVERFQGQEREVIVVSLASSKPEWVRRMAGFLFQRERWNVAVTRARRKVVVVASEGLLATAESLADAGDEGATCFSSWCRSVAPEAVIRRR